MISNLIFPECDIQFIKVLKKGIEFYLASNVIAFVSFVHEGGITFCAYKYDYTNNIVMPIEHNLTPEQVEQRLMKAVNLKI